MTEVRNDPLLGKIYASLDQSEITYQVLLEESLKADVIYLGENHNNKIHHQYQLQIVQDFIDQGKRPRIGFEFFSVDQTGYLMSFVTQQSSGPHGKDEKQAEIQLRQNLGWQDRPELTWQFYFRLIKQASENGLTVFGADLPNGIIRRLTRNGVDELNAVERGLLKSTNMEDEAYQSLMIGKFKEAHCGFAQPKMMEKMYQTWLERNDAMAHSIAAIHKEFPQEPIIVIIGSGHVEHNMGVYDRVKHHIPDIKQLNLGLMEITIKPSGLQEYFSLEKEGERVFLPAHEYVWFTQRSSYEDPCEKFREMLKRMKQ
ncbi:ChaN family lipoprotein [bacterium]|nr:ChaN family lipoprotein [bacterium]